MGDGTSAPREASDKIRICAIVSIEIDRDELAENLGPHRPVPRFSVEELATRRVRAAIGGIPGITGVSVTVVPPSLIGSGSDLARTDSFVIREVPARWIGDNTGTGS